MAEINIELINESVSTYLSSLQVNSPDFSITELKKELTSLIGQVPAIEVRRAEIPVNELITKSGAKQHRISEKIEEIYIYYVDLDNKKPIKLRMLF